MRHNGFWNDKLAAVFATLAFMVIAGPGRAAEQSAAFDLQCTGTTTFKIDKQAPFASPWEQHYRIDPNSMKWCGTDCQKVLPVEEITGSEYILARNDPSSKSIARLSIDRSSGVLTFYMSLEGTDIVDSAQCFRKPFSGFPAPKF